MKHAFIIIIAAIALSAIIDLLAGCSYKDMPEIEAQRFQLRKVEILTRYGGNKAALIWEGDWHILYYQQIDIDDTANYHVGMYSTALVKK